MTSQNLFKIICPFFYSFGKIFKNFVFRLILSVFILRKWNIAILLTDTEIVKRQSLKVFCIISCRETGNNIFREIPVFGRSTSRWPRQGLVTLFFFWIFFINFLKLNLILTSDSIFLLLLAIKIYVGKFVWGGGKYCLTLYQDRVNK